MAFNNPLPNVLVLGHSFVARLWNDIRFNHDPSHLHHNFGLAQATVRFLGFRGGVIQTLIEDVHDRLRQEMLQHSQTVMHIFNQCLNNTTPKSQKADSCLC
jgi:hypothetical protein